MAKDDPGFEWFLERLGTRWPGFGTEDHVTREVVEVIWQHLGAAADVATIVERLPMSRRSIERHFRRRFHCTIGQVSAFARFELAKWFLTETALPIRRVAEKAGYSSSDWMGKVIRRSTGMTPGEYRRWAVSMKDRV